MRRRRLPFRCYSRPWSSSFKPVEKEIAYITEDPYRNNFKAKFNKLKKSTSEIWSVPSNCKKHSKCPNYKTSVLEILWRSTRQFENNSFVKENQIPKQNPAIQRKPIPQTQHLYELQELSNNIPRIVHIHMKIKSELQAKSFDKIPIKLNSVLAALLEHKDPMVKLIAFSEMLANSNNS